MAGVVDGGGPRRGHRGGGGRNGVRHGRGAHSIVDKENSPHAV